MYRARIYFHNLKNTVKNELNQYVLETSAKYIDDDNKILCTRYLQYYEGDVVDNSRHGYGKQYTADPKGNIHVLEGTWDMDKFTGSGSVYYNLYILEGTFVNNLLHGKGKRKYFPASEKYALDGDWDMGRFTGYGKVGNYEGNFLKGKKHGYGKLMNADNITIYQGNWYHDRFY